MAYIYGATAGSSGSRYRAYISYTITQTATTYTITADCGIQALDALSYSSGTVDWRLHGSGTDADASSFGTVYDQEAPFSIAKNAYLKMCSATKTFTKETYSYNSWVLYGVSILSGSYTPVPINELSKAQLSITVPALQSYTVSYNANSGTGAPTAQAKYYGRTLALTTTKPTKSGYRFVKWNTKADGTGTSYNSGGSYTANAAVTLYAIWEWVYVPVKISNLVAQRCTSAGVIDDSGTYAKVTFNWTKGVEESGAVNPSSIKVGYKLTTASSYTFTNASDLTSGTVSIVIGSGNLSNDNTYDVEVIVSTSGHPDITGFTYISTSYFCIDVSPNGRSIGFGRSAPENKNGFFCGMAPFIDVNTTAGSTTIDGKLTAVLNDLGWSAVISGKDLDIKQLFQKILDKLKSSMSFSTRSVRKLCSSITQGVSDQEETVSLPSASYGTPIAVVGYKVGYYNSSYYRQVVVSGFWLGSSGAVFSLSNPFTSGTGQFYLTAYYLMIK